MSADVVYWAVEGISEVLTVPFAECLESLERDGDGELAHALPHIQRGEVVMLGGGAGVLGVAWMDTTGEGNDISDPARAFAIARGEEAR